MKFDVKTIENILIDIDPEGLIKLGAPQDEYSSEAKMIYNRIVNENAKDQHSILIKVVGVFFEMFACGRLASGESHISSNYIESINNYNIQKFKYVSKLIYESGKKE